MDGFLRRLDGVQSLAKNQKRERILIVFSDEEWDVKNLANAFGSGKENALQISVNMSVTNSYCQNFYRFLLSVLAIFLLSFKNQSIVERNGLSKGLMH